MKYEKTTLTPTQQFEIVLNGGKVFIENHDGIYIHINDSGELEYRAESACGDLFVCPAVINKTRLCYIEKPSQWFDEIPEGGVLCRVFDKNGLSGKRIALVIKYEDDKRFRFTCDSYEAYEEAVPLTESEIRQFLPTPKNWEDTVSTENPVECYVDYKPLVNKTIKQNIISYDRCHDFPYLTENNERHGHAMPVDPKLRN